MAKKYTFFILFYLFFRFTIGYTKSIIHHSNRNVSLSHQGIFLQKKIEKSKTKSFKIKIYF